MPASRWAAIIGFALAGVSQAQDYPSRPLRLIVASSPGSGVDIIGRVVAQRMSETLGTQVVVDVKELIALARARPGQLDFGSGGPGNSTHLAGELFKSLAQVDIVHVPYKGSGPAMVDLLGGHIHMMFANVVAILSHVKSGKVRAIATSGPKRSVALPDLPTVMEAGVPGYAVTSWFGMAAPARTPPDAVVKLNGALTAALRERDTLERIAAEGAEPAPGRPEEFGKLLATELATWARVIKAAGLQ